MSGAQALRRRLTSELGEGIVSALMLLAGVLGSSDRRLGARSLATSILLALGTVAYVALGSSAEREVPLAALLLAASRPCSTRPNRGTRKITGITGRHDPEFQQA
jgi:hypothetical protein